MANPFSKGWKYVMSSFDQKIDENADPKVQIQQAVEGARNSTAKSPSMLRRLLDARTSSSCRLTVS